jgi:hypothetical protein
VSLTLCVCCFLRRGEGEPLFHHHLRAHSRQITINRAICKDLTCRRLTRGAGAVLAELQDPSARAALGPLCWGSLPVQCLIAFKTNSLRGTPRRSQSADAPALSASPRRPARAACPPADRVHAPPVSKALYAEPQEVIVLQVPEDLAINVILRHQALVLVHLGPQLVGAMAQELLHILHAPRRLPGSRGASGGRCAAARDAPPRGGADAAGAGAAAHGETGHARRHEGRAACAGPAAPADWQHVPGAC